MKPDKIIEQGQEQAIASWINYLNQVRLNRLLETLKNEESNLEEAISTINAALKTIEKDIINNGHGRGGMKGMHGFIAEVAECGIGNARSQIEGKMPIYEWINDNGPEDLRRGTILIQQKFVNSRGHLSLQAIKMHLGKYPDFLDAGGKYQIPADHYQKIKWLLSISEEEANKIPTATGEFSMKQWKEVHTFFEKGDVPLECVEPSILSYEDVQKNTYTNTLDTEKENLRERNQVRRKSAYQKSKPSVQEGLKSAVLSGVVEGGTTLCMAVEEKRKSGKKLKDFDESDWKDIVNETGKGTVRGGVRGISIYALTNYTATPAAVASSLVTASFGVAEQAHLYREGKLNELDFIESSERMCLDTAVSALSSLAGQVLIPVPVLGAVIGNTVGLVMYQIARDSLSEKEQKLFEEYGESIRALGSDLAEQYQVYVDRLTGEVEIFMALLNKAFAPDIRIAFEGSVELAKAVGVPEEEILSNGQKIYSYFMM